MSQKGPKRTESERQAHRAEIARMLVESPPITQAEIAARIGISQQQVSEDLKYVRKQLAEQSLIDLQAAVGRELALLEWVQQQAVEGWMRSLRPAEKTFTEKKTVTGRTAVLKHKQRDGNTTSEVVELPDQETTKVSRSIEHQAGDARFLQAINNLAARRAELLGLAFAQRSKQIQEAGQQGEVLVYLPDNGRPGGPTPTADDE